MTEREWSELRDMPIGNLIVLLQKLAKRINYVSPEYRSAILSEAARRLSGVNNLAREMRKVYDEMEKQE